MLNACRLALGHDLALLRSNAQMTLTSTRSRSDLTPEERQGSFKALDIGLDKNPGSLDSGPRRKKNPERKVYHREKEMDPTQDWESVWPATRTFHPSVVPLPIRQGYKQIKSHIHLPKHGNTELLKIQNFLHLTPPVVKKHCNLIKKLTTPFPEGSLKNYPVIKTTSTYLNSSSSIRDQRSRIVTLEVNIDSLKLGPAAKEKFIRLVGNRYNPVTDTVTISADACPYRKQNREYAEYLLTALYHEAQKREAWEDLIEEADRFDFSGGQRMKEVMSEGENRVTLDIYQEKVIKDLMGMKKEA